MKFGQLTEYNMRNIFLEKSYAKYVSYTNCSQTLFLKINIEYISRPIVYSFIQFVFIVCKVVGYQNLLKLSCRPLAFISYKAF